MLEFQVARPGERALLCGGAASRRDFLHVGALAAVGLSLPQYARAASEGKVRPGHEKRSCIMIFNLGGPSNMDLWDMKPDAPAEIRGPLKPIRTKTAAKVKVVRHDFTDTIEFGEVGSGRNLPHGVFIDNLGLNGLLIVEGQNEREFFITAAPKAAPGRRLFHLRTSRLNRDRTGLAETSLPVVLNVLP